jgi:hypothetical protein
MATPKTVTDASSDLDEAVLNLFLRAGKVQVKINYCSILFTAATNVATVSSLWDSDGEIVSGDLSWVSTEINVVLTGFTAAPVALASIAQNSSTNVGAVLPRTDSSTAFLRFVGTGAGETAVDPDANIAVNPRWR